MIKVILNQLKKYWKEVLIIIALLMCFISMRSCNDNKKEVLRQKHNTEAALDSVRYYKDKNGELYGEKLSYIATQKEMEKINEGMGENIKALNRKLLAALNATVIIKDTIKLPGEPIYIDNDIPLQSFSIPFNDDILSAKLDLTYNRKETSSFLELKRFEYNINLPIEVYFTKDYSVILKTSGNNVSFGNVISFIDPSLTTKVKPKRHSIEFSIGMGASPYNIIDNKWNLHVGPYAGFTFNYNLINF